MAEKKKKKKKRKRRLFIDREFTEKQFEVDRTPDPMNLQTENVNQPGLHYYYGRLVEDAEHDMAVAELELEVYEADLADRIRANDVSRGERVTEAHIKREFRKRAKWLRLKRKAMKKKKVFGLLKKAFEAIKDKRSSLINLGTLYRDDPEVYILKEQAEKLRAKKSRKKKP